MKRIVLVTLLILFFSNLYANPISGLLERIDKGASERFEVDITNDIEDSFELSSLDNKIYVKANNFVSAAFGINWYLKYYAGINLSWNNMRCTLPDSLPKIEKPLKLNCNAKYRYYLNFCTFSYSMAFWDWNRWEREIDWMALHGINLSLATVGTEGVWVNVLKQLGYTEKEIDMFIAGPGFSAWWLMNNLEGWGGPNYNGWYKQQVKLQQKIIERMREFGISPVLPGYCGMIPSNANEKLGINAVNTGLWCGYKRPFFILPNDSCFDRIADLYYSEQTKLFGTANFYAIDPFHEGGVSEGVDMREAGKSIVAAMKRFNDNAVWVAQGWQGNPNKEMIDGIESGDMLILDLHSESAPQWENYGNHNWAYCMLLNFGANVGLHGKMDAVIDGYYNVYGKNINLVATGLTPEGIENNPVMYELFSELAWRDKFFCKEDWLKDYSKARYGKCDSTIIKVWSILGNSIYNAPKENRQQGTHESVFCARPDLDAISVSKWANPENYYSANDIFEAAKLMISIAENYRGNNNFEYDLCDIVRQAVSEKGRIVLSEIRDAYNSKNIDLYNIKCEMFLDLILQQDRLLGCRSEFMVGKWIYEARKLGKCKSEKDLCEWNAKIQITTWGDRVASESGGLRDYAHKEWNGILKDLYYKRWQIFFNSLRDSFFNRESRNVIDWFAIDSEWVNSKHRYDYTAKECCIDVAGLLNVFL